MARLLVLAVLVGSGCTQECIIPGLNCEDPEAFPEPGFLSVAVGDDHTCAIRDNYTVVCWGLDRDGSTIPPDQQFQSLAAGAAHTCGIALHGGFMCWGSPAYAQLPALPSYGGAAVGGRHTCVSSPLTCWGDNEYGQSTPPAISNASYLVLGTDHGCAVVSEPERLRMECWGRNDAGQATPPLVFPTGSLVAGEQFTCGLDGRGQLVCWGAPPADLPTSPGYNLVAGPRNLCAWDYASPPRCWGDNSAGVASPPDLRIGQVSVGRTHACGIALVDGRNTVVCWGSDEHGKATPPE